jgi:heptaprenyl diphosphate synthase
MKSLDVGSLLNFTELPKYLRIVENELDKTLTTGNPYIRKPVLRLIKARSKRLRPSLLMAIINSQGKKINKNVIASCVAVELVHLASLVHDDIIDNADTRWMVPTINAKEGSNYAIIIGDYLFAKANQVAASVSVEVARIIAQTIEELCDGEIREMADQYNVDRSIGSLMQSIEGKTAALISATTRIGGICSGLPDKEIKSLDKYGRAFGVSFQLIDDVLDLLSSDELLGKPVGNDINEGVFTLPILLTTSGPDDHKIRSILRDSQNLKNSAITDILLANGAIEKTIILAHEYNVLAVKELINFTEDKVKINLSALPKSYFDWAFGGLIDKKYKPNVASVLSKLSDNK